MTIWFSLSLTSYLASNFKKDLNSTTKLESLPARII